MADGQTNPLQSASAAREKPAQQAGAEVVAQGREEKKLEATRQRVDISGEMLERRTMDLAARIERLDVNKPLREQHEEGLLFIGTMGRIAIQLINAGHKIENTVQLRAILADAATAGSVLDEHAEPEAAEKFKQLTQNPSAALALDCLPIIQRQLPVAQLATRVAQRAGGQELPPLEDPQQREKEAGITESFRKLPRGVKIACAVGGGLLAIGAIKWIAGLFSDGTEDAPKEGGKSSGWGKKLAVSIGVLGAAAIGIILGKEKIEKLFGFKFGDIGDAVKKFVSGDSEGGLAEIARKHPVSALHNRVGEKLSLHPALVAAMGEQNFLDVVSDVGKLKAVAVDFMHTLLPDIQLGGIIDTKTQEEAAKAAKKLVDFLRDHRDEIGSSPNPETLQEALERLDAKGLFGAVGAGARAAALPAAAAASAGEKKETEVKAEEWQKYILDKFKDHPEIIKLLTEKYPPETWFSNTFPYFSLPRELAQLCWDKKLPLIVGGGAVTVWNGVEWVVVSAFKPLIEAFGKVLQAPFSDDVTMLDAVETYVDGVQPFIYFGAGVGLLKGMISGNKLSNIVKGALKGAAAPLTALQLAYKGTRFMTRAGAWTHEVIGGSAKYGLKRLAAPRALQEALWLQEAKFYGDLFKKWDAFYSAVENGTWRHLPDVQKKLLARVLFSKPQLKKMSEAMAKKFAVAYNNAHKLSSLDPNFLRLAGDELIHFKDTRKALKEVDEALKAATGALSAPDGKIAGPKEAEPLTADELSKKISQAHPDDPKVAEAAKTGKYAKYLPLANILMKAAGIYWVVATVYNLESATDKRAALAHETVSYAAFLGGVKTVDALIGSKFANPLIRAAVDVFGAAAVAMGISEPLGNLVDNYLAKIPGSQKLAKEGIDIAEKVGGRLAVRSAARSIEKGLLQKIGMKKIEQMLTKKVTSDFLKNKVAKLAAKQGVKQLLKMLGWRGATTAALLADDATANPLAIIDDIVAVGLTVSMAPDIYDAVQAVRNAIKIQEAFKDREGKEIEDFHILNREARIAFQKNLAGLGVSPDSAPSAQITDESLFDAAFGAAPKVVFEVRRSGVAGREEWTIENKKVQRVRIFDDHAEVTAELGGDDVEAFLEEAAEEGRAAQAS